MEVEGNKENFRSRKWIAAIILWYRISLVGSLDIVVEPCVSVLNKIIGILLLASRSLPSLPEGCSITWIADAAFRRKREFLKGES